MAQTGVVSNERDMVMLSYLNSMRELVDAQRQVFLRYLGGPVESDRTAPAPPPVPDPVALSGAAATVTAPSVQPDVANAGSSNAVTPEAATASAPAPAPQAKSATPAGPDIMTLLTTLVSERTGYPLDMLGADLDLEADLSIDSIKRLEILGELTERAGLAAASNPGESLDESIVEELVAQKSLRAIVAWVEGHLVGNSAGAAAADSAGDAAAALDR